MRKRATLLFLMYNSKHMGENCCCYMPSLPWNERFLHCAKFAVVLSHWTLPPHTNNLVQFLCCLKIDVECIFQAVITIVVYKLLNFSFFLTWYYLISFFYFLYTALSLASMTQISCGAMADLGFLQKRGGGFLQVSDFFLLIFNIVLIP